MDQDSGCKGSSSQQCPGSNPGNVVVLTEPNHAHDPTHDHALGMMSDPGQFTVSHQPSAAEDMVYNNAMLQSAASMVDQDHGEHDVDIPVSEIEVNGHHHHHHDLQEGDIVITW